jgi:uncharacterized membrane protein
MTPQDQQNQLQSLGGDTVREQDKIQLVLAYLGCLSLIPFLTVKDSEFVKFHAKQGIVFNIGFGIGLTILSMIPFVNFATCLLGPAMIVVDIMAIMKALKGERWRLPVVADLADKF